MSRVQPAWLLVIVCATLVVLLQLSPGTGPCQQPTGYSDGEVGAPLGTFPTEQARRPSLTYDGFINDVFASLGEIGTCLFDPGMFETVAAAERAARANASSEDSTASSFLPKEALLWDLSKRFHAPPQPTTFGDREQQIRRLRVLFSIALGRLKRESRLRDEFDELSSLASSDIESIKSQARIGIAAFKKALGSKVVATVQYVHTILQMLSDVGRRTPSSSIDLTREICAGATFQPQGTPVPWIKARTGALGITAGAPAFEAQSPKNGRFWNALRPTLGCSQLHRLCEQPDGCRYVCNFDFTLFAGSPYVGNRRVPTLAGLALSFNNSVRWKQRALDFVGFGSNNEFDWEESIVRSHRDASRSLSEPLLSTTTGQMRVNPVRHIVAFDCTIQRATPPPSVANMASPSAFGFAKFCLDKEASQMSITLVELQRLLRQGARPLNVDALPKAVVSARNTAVESSEGDAVQWFPQPPDAGRRKTSFRRLALLKIDVEGYEFGAVPQWLRDEIGGVEMMRPHDDDASSTRSFALVDQLQFELHRLGHKGNAGASYYGALQAHLLLLHLHALGFNVIAQERNHADNCCYEFTAVGWWHYVVSEAWLAMNA